MQIVEFIEAGRVLRPNPSVGEEEEEHERNIKRFK
jgi:hypothetical protein